MTSLTSFVPSREHKRFRVEQVIQPIVAWFFRACALLLERLLIDGGVRADAGPLLVSRAGSSALTVSPPGDKHSARRSVFPSVQGMDFLLAHLETGNRAHRCVPHGPRAPRTMRCE
jgi:hypothetical protein